MINSMKLKKTITALTLALVCQLSYATIRYASPTGTDRNGTSPDAPGRLSTMIGKLQPGDELYLLDGQYDLTSTLSINRSGTADQMIVIAAAEGATPILDFRNQALRSNAVKVGGSYIHIKGIVIRYAGYKGIWIEGGKYNILEQLEVYGCCNAGIQLRSGGYNMVINCDSHDNFDYQDDGGNADGFADKQGDACPGNIYVGCRSWNNSDDGWDSFQRVTDGNPTAYINCIAYNNGPATFDISNHPRVLGVDANLDIFKGKDLKNYPNGGNPNGFKLGGKGTNHNAELYRCLAIGHRSKGFDQNNNAGVMTVVNCSAYSNQINYGFGNSYAYTLNLYNCISLAPTGGNSSHLKTASSGTIHQSNNTWLAGYSVSADDFESLDESLAIAARNSDGTLPLTLLMRLKPTATNLIDQGSATAYSFSNSDILPYVSYSGTAPDLGCYELDVNDGIISVYDNSEQLHPTLPRFDLQGRRVTSNYKGIVIQGGKKYFCH